MTDTYTIRADDQVSGPAAKMATAYARVAVTAGALAAAMRSGDSDAVRFARSAGALAGAELRAARACQSAGAALDTLRVTTKKTGDETEKTKRKAKDFSYILNGLATGAANAAFNLAGKLASGLIDIGKGLYDTAELASRTKLGFRTLFGGVEQGEAAMKSAIELSRKYGISIEDVTQAVTMFKGANFDTGQIETLIKLGADMKSIGAKPEQIESAFLAFRKIQSQGYLQGDELNMLSEAGLSVDKVYTNLEKTLGKTREEIVKMQGNRQLQAGDTLNAVAKSILQTAGAKRFGEMGEKAANETIGGITGRLKANLGADLFEAVGAAEPALVKGMQSLLSGGLGAGDATASLKDQLTAALVKVGEGLQAFGPKIPALAADLGAIASALGKIVGFIASLSDAKERTGMGLIDYDAGKIASTIGQKTGITDFFGDIWKSATQGRGDPYEVGKNISEGLAAGITAGAPSVGNAAGAVAQGAIDATKATTQTHSPSRVMFEQGGFFAEGMALGIDDQASMAQRSSAAMAEGAIAESSAAVGRSQSALSIGAAAGDTLNHSTISGGSIGAVHFDVHLGGSGGGDEAVQQLRDFVDLELAALLERAVEGSGA